MAVTIRPLADGDFEAWYPLWQGYLTFYKSEVPDDVTKRTFGRLIDPNGDVDGLAALDESGAMIGFVTYLFHPFTWSDKPRCYLGDLFTSESARGKGVGRTLIEEVRQAAIAKGAGQVYWLTQEFNYAGRTLYDKVADRTPFIKYQQTL